MCRGAARAGHRTRPRANKLVGLAEGNGSLGAQDHYLTAHLAFGPWSWRGRGDCATAGRVSSSRRAAQFREPGQVAGLARASGRANSWPLPMTSSAEPSRPRAHEPSEPTITSESKHIVRRSQFERGSPGGICRAGPRGVRCATGPLRAPDSDAA